MGNYKNPNAIDVIISGAKTTQGGFTVSAGVTGKYGEDDSTPVPRPIDATVTGRVYGKYKNTGSTINYYQ